MSHQLKILIAATTLIIAGASSAIAEDVRPSDLYIYVPTGPSAQVFDSVGPKSLLKYDTGAPQTEDFIDRRTAY